MIRLKQLREKKSLTQSEFGKLFNASQNTVSNWENGNRKIDYDRLMQFASYFGVSIEYLLGGDDSIDKKENLPTAQGDEQDARLVKSILSLPPREKDAVKALVEALEAAHSGSLGLQAHQEELPSQK